MPTLTDVEPLARTLRDLTPGAPLTHGALTVIPLLAPGAPDPGWLTLAEAGDTVTIEEVSEAGAVPTLRLTSAADRPVLLLDGDAVPAPGSEVVAGEAVVGAVTSATRSFGLDRPIALAMVRRPHAEPGTAVGVRVDGRVIPATVSALPFARR